MSLSPSSICDNKVPGLASTNMDINVAMWELDTNTKQIVLSVGFYKALGYELGEIDSSYENFIDTILYYQDKPVFLASINQKQNDDAQVTNGRLLTKEGYKWFQISNQKQSAFKIIGTITNIHEFKLTELKLLSKNKKYAEANKIAKSGGWEIDVSTNTLTLSDQIYALFELKDKVAITVEEFISFFEPDYRTTITNAINANIKYGKPYDLDVQLRTIKNNLLWVKIKAVATIDDYGQCIAVKGILQDVSQSKERENKLKASYDLADHQNKRLQNFAYIVSHNLRSHVGNLQLLINLHEETEEQSDRQEIFSHMKTISKSLDSTLEHLNEIVKIEADVNKEKQLTQFEPLYKNVVNSQTSNIESAHAIISYNFSKCPDVYYIPAYLESIFHNLLTNSLKYRHPDRQPIIKCHTEKRNNHVYIIFEDNGRGIDMARYGHMVFGMYQTFHDNPDSKGIGLFITRNQIEALGGNINVESTVNVGTKFTIRLV